MLESPQHPILGPLSHLTSPSHAPPVWRTYSAAEELTNTLTHAIGCPLTIFAVMRLLKNSKTSSSSRRHFWALVIYGVSLFSVFLTSMLYHGTREKWLKGIFQMGDHFAIFLLIGGSYTPFCLGPLWQGCGLTLFLFVWIAAVAGILGKLFFWDWFLTISLPYFLSLGWSGVVAAFSMFRALPVRSSVLVCVSAAIYSGGCFFFVRDAPYDHAVWHLCVLAGSTAVYIAVGQFM
jgi:hemolysin III